MSPLYQAKRYLLVDSHKKQILMIYGIILADLAELWMHTFQRFGSPIIIGSVQSLDNSQTLVLSQDPKKSGHRGFGFVTFAEDGVADRVARRSHEILGQEVRKQEPLPQLSLPKMSVWRLIH